MKRAIRRLVEHTEMAVDEQNNPSDEKQSGKIMANIAIISDNCPINIMSSKFYNDKTVVCTFFSSTLILLCIN